ncbi:Six-bladed beta-propeller TolB-like protein [Neofusicoccum parvum]|uniref:Six-bladed beta-propeller TolB-like protein n=1 Tax=Neofusicoccum parvum TaxID=310453 RepID=A0ACB5SPZ2_9PEZI|nr:Six-bladed beta-propeller TolB-like protein [Neofusicoccum parvum]
MFLIPLFCFSLILLSACSASTHTSSRSNAVPPTTRASSEVIYQFPNGTWLENIAVRPNGNLLVTLVNVPEVWEVDPSARTAHLLHRFATSRQATGIAEIRADVFAIASDSSIHILDLTATPATPTLLATIQDTTLNGLTFAPAPANSSSAGTLLASDSSGGVIWRIDPDPDPADPSSHFGIALWDASMHPVPGARRSGALIGVNGVRYDPVTQYVHYVNLPRLLYCRVRVDPGGGAAAVGPHEVLARDVMADDFALAGDGSGVVYLAGLDRNVVVRVGEGGGTVEVVAGGLNSTEVAGATSAAFGRTEGDRGVLYVTTGGGTAAPVNGTFTEGGKIVAIRM